MVRDAGSRRLIMMLSGQNVLVQSCWNLVKAFVP